ncbi:hypothetical protein VII00023_08914 [Vibrio ichthyoenteri ATCC 700023]|uniref:Transcriptional regulator n=1 Tax=Vibrio ichthyoenteri ATCC 700023 TaxID=870968 RepID=F9S582_9VIBR|nr:response regulator [Vibrio ichthyoenteri]EGU35948.1 hypothetical protein VII00023_08914 [Vibrio ichthyoenteri ATCC 700023]
MSDKLTVVIIEDEPAIADNLIHVLEMDGYQTQWFATAGEGLSFLQANMADLLVLDVGLPDGNGFELCKTIRDFSDIPIIFLTARNDEIDRVVGLEIGADDYVTKPFSPREMVARVKLRIKRRVPSYSQASVEAINHAQKDLQPPQPTMEAELLPHNFDYQLNGQSLGLTAVEFKILDKLILLKGHVLSREQLMIAADMAAEAVYERNIDTHIKAIRNKLKPFGLAARIGTKRGFGYFYSAKGEL